MIGINSCIEMDITGQAASASIGSRIYSGFGGQANWSRVEGSRVEGQRIRGGGIVLVGNRRLGVNKCTRTS